MTEMLRPGDVIRLANAPGTWSIGYIQSKAAPYQRYDKIPFQQRGEFSICANPLMDADDEEYARYFIDRGVLNQMPDSPEMWEEFLLFISFGCGQVEWIFDGNEILYSTNINPPRKLEPDELICDVCQTVIHSREGEEFIGEKVVCRNCYHGYTEEELAEILENPLTEEAQKKVKEFAKALGGNPKTEGYPMAFITEDELVEFSEKMFSPGAKTPEQKEMLKKYIKTLRSSEELKKKVALELGRQLKKLFELMQEKGTFKANPRGGSMSKVDAGELERFIENKLTELMGAPSDGAKIFGPNYDRGMHDAFKIVRKWVADNHSYNTNPPEHIGFCANKQGTVKALYKQNNKYYRGN